MCKAIVNEDPTAKMIRDLREEVARLQALGNEGLFILFAVDC